MDSETQKRIQAKGWFLTWPQCSAEKERCLEHLRSIAEVEEYIVAREKHEDGNYHLHAFVKYNKKVYWKKDKWDFDEFHGNYQVAKCWKAVEKYVKKGEDFITSIEIESAKAKKGKNNIKMLESDPLEVLESGDIGYMQLKNLVANQQLYQLLKQKRSREEIPILNKQRHVWNYGESNTGKTEKLKAFMNSVGLDNCFTIPYNNDWIGYTDQKYLIADEYKGQLTVQDLNRVCDGGAKMNTKGGTIQLRWDVEVIICSNLEIECVYCNCKQEIIQTVLNRFNVNKYEKN